MFCYQCSQTVMGEACALSHRAATLHRFNAKKGKKWCKKR
jgi:hypothetical protein